MLVVFNILFELLTNVYRDGDTLLGENDLDIQQQPVVNNNKQLVLVAHIQLVETNVYHCWCRLNHNWLLINYDWLWWINNPINNGDCCYTSQNLASNSPFTITSIDGLGYQRCG